VGSLSGVATDKLEKLETKLEKEQVAQLIKFFSFKNR
jgi:hypothetical protein